MNDDARNHEREDVNLTYHGFEICNQLSSYIFSFYL
jgi:hypothetical protein